MRRNLNFGVEIVRTEQNPAMFIIKTITWDFTTTKRLEEVELELNNQYLLILFIII